MDRFYKYGRLLLLYITYAGKYSIDIIAAFYMLLYS